MRKTRPPVREAWKDFFYGQAPKHEPCKIIENRTAWRIVIFAAGAKGKPGAAEDHDGQLILAPFAKRILKCEILVTCHHRIDSNCNKQCDS